MSDQRPDNPFDAMRRVIRAEANQDDDGGYIPGLALITNNLGRPEYMVRRKKKRRPIVKVRSKNVAIGGGWTVKSWKWECRICKQTWWSLGWWTTQNSADRHAHNHH